MDAQPMVIDLVRALRHQLRTPVNHIIGFSEMLQEEAADRCWDALLPDLDRVREVGRGLTEFIGNTVDVAKVEAGKLDPAQISRDLRTPLESITGYSQLLQEVADEKGWAEALPDLRKIESAARYLTGLIRAVIDLATVYGADGHPRHPAATRRPSDEPPLAPAAHLREQAGAILIADDNELDTEMLVRRLCQFGHAIAQAATGREALDLLTRREFDLVLLDVRMPELDGFETLRAMRASDALHDLPAIMVSASEEIPLVVRCIEMGADDYLVKPINPVLLRAKVAAALERRRLRSQERAYLGHVAKLTAAAAALEADTYVAGELAEVAVREDSLGRLARVFERMALQLQAREESLQQQVKELRIEIDQVKLARDLADITNADYFQEVRRRSERMRTQWSEGQA